MLDKKTTSVLKILSKLAQDNAYKVITGEEVLSNITQKSQYDLDTIKQIIEFLEKQEYITIKFSEENTYCYSLLPKARIFIEQENFKTKPKKNSKPIISYVLTMAASLIGSLLALIIFFYTTF